LNILMRIGEDGDIDFCDISASSAFETGCVALPSTSSTEDTQALSSSTGSRRPIFFNTCGILGMTAFLLVGTAVAGSESPYHS
jgi:hypothetical protein